MQFKYNQKKIKELNDKQLYALASWISTGFSPKRTDEASVKKMANELKENPKKAFNNYEMLINMQYCTTFIPSRVGMWKSIVEDDDVETALKNCSEALDCYSDPSILIFLIEGIASGYLKKDEKKYMISLINRSVNKAEQLEFLKKCLYMQQQKYAKLTVNSDGEKKEEFNEHRKNYLASREVLTEINVEAKSLTAQN